MKVLLNSGKVGITEIYTSDLGLPDQLGLQQPHKKPFIIFALPYDDDHLSYLESIELGRIGTVDVQNNQFFVTVTNPQNVIEAIDTFLSISQKYNVPSNQILFQHLHSFRKICEAQAKAQQEIKKKRPAPTKSKEYSALQFHENKKVPASTYDVKHASKITNPKKRYIFKKSPGGRSISEFEAFNGFCYRLLLGERHPKVSVVYHEDGTRAGLVSKEIDGFVSFRDLGRRTITPADLLKSEIVKIWAAAYTEEENDLHSGNYGIGAHGFAVKIDDDQATWPLTSKYAMVSPKHTLPTLGYKTAPVNAFRVTRRDIENFPVLQDADPHNWPDRPNQNPLFNALIPEKKFQQEKYYMFLKRILIPRGVYEAIGLATIRSDKKRKEFVDHKCNKTEELKKVLLNTPAFQNYIINNPTIIAQILNEFKQYNEDYKKDNDSHLKVHLNEISHNFENIRSEIYQITKMPFPVNNLDPEIQNMMDELLTIFDYKKNAAQISLSPGKKFEDLLKLTKIAALKTDVFNDELASVKAELARLLRKEISDLASKADNINNFLLETKKIIANYKNKSEGARTHTVHSKTNTDKKERALIVNIASTVIHPPGKFDEQLDEMDTYLNNEIAKQVIYESIENSQNMANILRTGVKQEEELGNYQGFYRSIEMNVEPILKKTHKKQLEAINKTLNKLHEKILFAMHTIAPLQATITMPSQFFRKGKKNITRGELSFTNAANQSNELKEIAINEIPINEEFNDFKDLAKQYNAAIKIKKAGLMKNSLYNDCGVYAIHIVKSAKLTRQYEQTDKISLKEDPTWTNVAKVAFSILTGGLGYIALAAYHGTFNIFKPSPLKIYDPLRKLTQDQKIHQKLNPIKKS